MMCKVAAIIVSYNPDSNLFDSINLLLNQVEKVIIVDNGSKEKYVKYIKSINEDKIEIILNKENLGIATALNIGVRKALENGYEWILTMDQDSKASPDMVKKMFNVYNSINREERKDILSIFPNFVDERIQSIEENSNMNSYEYVDADITSGNLLRKEVFEKVGFFDDSLFCFIYLPKLLIASSKGDKSLNSPSLLVLLVYLSLIIESLEKSVSCLLACTYIKELVLV